MAEKKLTKRERKAAAFKNRKKQKQEFTEDKAFPAPDLVEESTPVDNNKRKRDDDDDKDESDETVEQQQQQQQTEEGEEKKKNKPKRKRSRKSKEEEPQEKKPRYIIFVGNLPYDTTKESLAKHFESVGGEPPSVRLMTEKGTNKPKGFAFVEFQEAAQLKKALAFHHTFFKKRQINVELTAGGGGKTEARKEKLRKKNEKLRKERQKRHEVKVLGKGSGGSSYANQMGQSEETGAGQTEEDEF